MRDSLEQILSADDSAGTVFTPDIFLPTRSETGGGRPNMLSLVDSKDAATVQLDTPSGVPIVVAQQSSPAHTGSSFFSTVQQSATNAGAVVTTKAKRFWAWVKSFFNGSATSATGAKVANPGSSDNSWLLWVFLLGAAAAIYYAVKRKPGKSIFPTMGRKAVKIR